MNQNELIQSIINSLVLMEGSERNPNNTDYDNGFLDGSHDTYIDILDALEVNHAFKSWDSKACD